MEVYASVILATIALFAAIILQLAAKPRFAGRVTGIFIILAVIGGVFFYGYGFAAAEPDWSLAVIRALLAVCGMFVGKVDYGSIGDASIFQAKWVQLIFWIVHLMALYATASAAITTIGAEALKKLRLWLARRGELHLIYGVSADSVYFGKTMSGKKNNTVVFVDGDPAASFTAAITKAGFLLHTDSQAISADRRFVRSIGIRRGKRKITLYALRKDESDNFRYAKAFLKTMQATGVSPEQTSLVIAGHEDAALKSMQVTKDTYGYGYITVFQEAGLAARLLVQEYPPYESISFDADGKATEDFEALIVGFGQVGQAVLRSLVMNGQFEGSTFRAAVFAPDHSSVSGYFSSNFENVLEKYDISFYPYDARSKQMYQHIASRRDKIKYVVLCAGNDLINGEIAADLMGYFARLKLRLPIYQCSYSGVKTAGIDGSAVRLYHPRVLATQKLDAMAMVINQHYQKNGDMLENWMNCDYFSRMSCRASADFIGAMLRAAGKTEEQAAAGEWTLSDAQLNNLSKTEHLRWCAFHYCMGFSAMTQEEFASRANEYRRQLEENGEATIRIGKNMQGLTHACLVDWDELDELSAREAAVTGRYVDYKVMDTDNVLAVPDLLRAARESEGRK